MSNTDIWDDLGRTDPKHTKQFSRAGGFKGTAIKPIWIIHRLTERFGPCGEGWGINEPTFQVVHGHNNEVLVYCTVSGWHGRESRQVWGVGGDKVVTHIKANEQYKRPERWENDDEAFKKAFTDAVGNAFKFIGVGADVHMGQFEDSKYVREVEAEFAQAEEKPEKPKTPAKEKMEGPQSTVTGLRNAAKKLIFDAGKMEDMIAFNAFMKENEPIVAQVKRYQPEWWDGGPNVPQGMKAQLDDIANRLQGDITERDTGGSDEESNFDLLMRHLNATKSAKGLADWYKTNAKFVEEETAEHRDALRERYRELEEGFKMRDVTNAG